MAIANQEVNPSYSNGYNCPVYDCSGNGSESSRLSEELKSFNPDRETLQQQHDFLVALLEAGVIYVREIADYQIAMRREAFGQVLPLERSPFRDTAREQAQRRASSQLSPDR
jgi:hypothetical protein